MGIILYLCTQLCIISDKAVYRFCDHGYNVQEDGVYMTREYYQTHRRQARKFADASRLMVETMMLGREVTYEELSD
ncbi:MAG: hypothetical protein II822_11610 [Prevotella sp.]|nr:hypothetical protein [Prevotella sp.]